ncbi:MAG: GNAT family N-acetyltransferase [Actinobacteria bacterium]|nr:GNAT family N-acetyltransferase [Actinomycetota bacterium]
MSRHQQVGVGPIDVPDLSAGPLLLRRHRLDDVDDIVLACRDEQTWTWTTVPNPYEPEHAEAYINRTVGTAVDGETRWAIEVDGRFSGNIGAMLDGEARRVGGAAPVGLSRADVGYFVAPWARGRGIGSLALWLVCDWAFREGDCEVVTWNALVGNVPSRRMVEKVGFHVHSDPARRMVVQRGERVDVWTADLLPEDLVPLTDLLR